MLINEVSKLTNLTKKAIEYYTMHGLIKPQILENSYRDYSTTDIEKLKKKSVLRKLGISTSEIDEILNDETGVCLKNTSVKKELCFEREEIKKFILNKLSEGKSYTEIETQLKALEQSELITDKLLSSFPGDFGRFICLHFARFLNEPITTEKQSRAFETVIKFLDNLPQLHMPKEIGDYLREGTKHLGAEQIQDMLKSQKAAIESPNEFFSDNKEMLQQYLEYKSSDEYKNSSAAKLMELMREFNASVGYNDVFIPAMKELSVSYADYYKQLEAANEIFLKQYPDAEKSMTAPNK